MCLVVLGSFGSIRVGFGSVVDVSINDVCEYSFQIRFKTLRWLGGHLDSILQNGGRKVVHRGRSEDEPE